MCAHICMYIYIYFTCIYIYTLYHIHIHINTNIHIYVYIHICIYTHICIIDIIIYTYIHIYTPLFCTCTYMYIFLFLFLVQAQPKRFTFLNFFLLPRRPLFSMHWIHLFWRDWQTTRYVAVCVAVCCNLLQVVAGCCSVRFNIDVQHGMFKRHLHIYIWICIFYNILQQSIFLGAGACTTQSEPRVSATRCNTLQHAATRCNILQRNTQG